MLKLKNYSTEFKLENFLSGTSQISNIRHLVSMHQTKIHFFTHPVLKMSLSIYDSSVSTNPIPKTCIKQCSLRSWRLFEDFQHPPLSNGDLH